MASGDVLAKKYVEFAQRGMGSIQAFLRDIGKEATRAQGRAQLLNKHLNDGTYQKAANQLAQIRRQYAAMGQAARMQDLIAENGKFAGTLMAIQERMQGVTRAAGIGFGVLTATTMGWVTAGMSGTIEAYRLQTGFSLLSREIASVFKPAIDTVTGWLFNASGAMRGMTGEQQSQVRSWVLWTAGILGGVLVLRTLAGTLAMVSAAYFKMNAAGSASNVMLARMFTMRNLIMAGGIGLAAYAVNEATAGPTDSAEDRGALTKTGNLVSRGLGSTVDAFQWMFDSKSRPEIRKRERMRTLESREEWGNLKGGEKEELAKLRAEKKPRSDVSLDGGGFSAIGTAWDRIATESLKMSDPMLRLADGMDMLTVVMKELKETMAKLERGAADPFFKDLEKFV